MYYFLMTLIYEHVLRYISFPIIFYLCRTKEINKFKIAQTFFAWHLTQFKLVVQLFGTFTSFAKTYLIILQHFWHRYSHFGHKPIKKIHYTCDWKFLAPYKNHSLKYSIIQPIFVQFTVCQAPFSMGDTLENKLMGVPLLWNWHSNIQQNFLGWEKCSVSASLYAVVLVLWAPLSIWNVAGVTEESNF